MKRQSYFFSFRLKVFAYRLPEFHQDFAGRSIPFPADNTDFCKETQASFVLSPMTQNLVLSRRDNRSVENKE
jgi:hypothetical protein